MAPAELRCVDVTSWADEDVEAAVAFLGQLSGRLIAVEGARDREEEALSTEEVARTGLRRVFCGRLWVIEDLTEADVWPLGLRLIPGFASPGWRVWVGGRDYLIWRDASCSRRSLKLRHEGEEWWRAQVHVVQRRWPQVLNFFDCTRDPPGAPHDSVIDHS